MSDLASPRRRRRAPRRPGRLAAAATALALGAVASGAAACSDAGSSSLEEDKVTVAGDSISVGLGAQLRDRVDDDVEVKVIGVGGTGLARADAFDWPARLEQLAAEFPPEVLVLSLGSNDAQDLVGSTGGVVVTMSDAEGWDAEYRRRLGAAFDAFEGTGTTIVWVGHVRTAEDRVGLVNRRVHRLAEQAAAERDWVVVEDLGAILGSGEQVALDCLLPDGLHLNASCLDVAAAHLADNLPT